MTDLPIYAAAGLSWPGAVFRSVTVPPQGIERDGMCFGNIELVANHRFRPAFEMLHTIEAQVEFDPGEFRAAVSALESYVSSAGFSAGITDIRDRDPDHVRKIIEANRRLTAEARAHFLGRIDKLRASAGGSDIFMRPRPALALPGDTGSLSKLLAEHIAIDYSDFEIVGNGLGGRSLRKIPTSKKPKLEQSPCIALFEQIYGIITPTRNDLSGVNYKVNQTRSDARKAGNYGSVDPGEIKLLQAAVRMLAQLAAIDLSPVTPTAGPRKTAATINRDIESEGSAYPLARARGAA